jgi:hypothetical protein
MRHDKDIAAHASTNVDRPRRERLVAAILARAAPELERRRHRRDVLHTMIAWKHPILAVAGTLTAAGLATLLLVEVDRPPRVADVEEEAAIPNAVVAWLAQGEPDLVELLAVAREARR